MQSTPVFADGVLYATTPTLKVVALDAATGRQLWMFDPSNGAAAGARFRHRGVVVHGDRVFVTYRNWLYALHAASGQPIGSFGTDGRVDLREGLGRPADKLTVTASTPGVVFEDLLIMGSTVPETLPSAPGDIRAFDINTGKIRWSFHTIPHPGERGYETWPPDAWRIAGGANAWAGVTVDQGWAMVFAATGSASFDFYGANRKGDNLFADSVLALDARTGKYVWHFQGLKHDVWDLDFPAAPALVTVTRDGRKVDAVAQVTKTGIVFVLDRETGKPLFPIEQRAVPASRIAGESLSPTQPIPVRPPRFVRSGPTEAMLTQRTPEAHAAVLAQFRGLKAGLFEPPSTEGTIIFPGVDGGAEWGGAAFDPESALLFVNANEMPWIVRLIPNDDTSLYTAKCAACHKGDRTGTPAAPSLIDIGARKTREQLADVIRHGTGRMPGYPDLGAKNTNDLVEFLITGKDRAADPGLKNDPTYVPYRSDGETLWRDPDGYPPLTPPWGTLNAIDLNAGTIRWQIPFGEYPELVAKGVRNTGSDNYGGPVVTATGLVFIGATNFDRKFHAFDKLTGKLLWETTLPAAGNATPVIYSMNGRQFIAISCGGGKNGAPSGSSIVAFALPQAPAQATTAFDAAFARLKAGRDYARGTQTGAVKRRHGQFEYWLVVPPTYDPSKRYQVRFQLHGGVMRPDSSLRGDGSVRLAGTEQIYIMPAGWSEAPWWSDTQVASLHAILEDVKRDYNVDENRVFVSGVSDGGTGAYYIAMRDTTPYAGFLPLNGYLLVLRSPGVDGGNLFINNLRNKPLFIVNGGKDPLYPIDVVEPSIVYMNGGGIDITYRPQPQAGHDTSWWDVVKTDFEAFTRSHPRAPLPDRLTWEVAGTGTWNRAHWLVIDALGATPGDAADMDDMNISGGRPIFKNGKSGRVDLRRSGNTIVAATRGVKAFTLLLSPDQFDFDQPFKVIVNGRVAFEGRVEKRVETLQKWAARDNDRTMLFAAELKITP